MSLLEYYHDYMQEIYARAGSEDDFTEEQFLEEMCEFLVDTAVIESFDSCFYRKSTQGTRIDAWNLNLEKQELSIIICDFIPSKELRTLTQSETEAQFRRAEKFFSKAQNLNFLRELEESLPVYGVAYDIAKNIDNISKVKFFLLSNATLSDRFKGFESRKIPGYQVRYDVWDMSRRARISESGKEKEDITIDLTEFVPGGIRCLPAYTGSDSCKSYLLAIPGAMLASMYDKYGERLLEQNVRTFLQFRGKVNKGIRNTIKNEPDMFFAYNNGLTVTAEATVVHDDKLMSVRNLQIVNGGQTTASIFMSELHGKGKDAVDLSKVFVQVKLTVIEPDLVDAIVPEISRFANTQNKVSDSDFFSNHPFHKRIEDFSRRILAPSVNGGLTETYWFYERARGQFSNRQAKMTPSQIKKFLIQHPKNQRFTKTDLAKYENSFAQQPHFVSKGAQWNFANFAEKITGKGDDEGFWERNENQFNELYYKEIIAKAIFFQYLDRNIMRQDWYGGYKANIITYTLAKFSHLVTSLGKYIDFMQVWQNQAISEPIQKELISISKLINSIITDTELNVTQYCKQSKCWDRVRSENYILCDDVVSLLSDSQFVKDVKIRALKEQKELKKINYQIEVFEKGEEYWTSLYIWATKSKIFSDKELSILSTTKRMNSTPPTEKQCKRILEIETIALEEGFFVARK
jgi:hypothetical protein